MAAEGGGAGGGTPWGTIWGGIIGGIMGIDKHEQERSEWKQKKAMSANAARYNHATGFGFDNAKAPSTGENIGGGIIAGMQGGSALDGYGAKPSVTGGSNYQPEMTGSGRGGNPKSQEEASDIGRYDYVPNAGSRNPPSQSKDSSYAMTNFQEMQQDVDEEKERDRQERLAMQNPWMKMQMRGQDVS